MLYPERRSTMHDLLEDVFDYPFARGFSTNTVMKTDVHEKDGMLRLDVDLPGFKKEEVKINLQNGNLIISAQHQESQQEKDAKGDILRQERYVGSMSRSWYVGEGLQASDIHAAFHDGVLTIDLPGKEKRADKEEKEIVIL